MIWFSYDSDDNPVVGKKTIEPIPPLDHSQIEYPAYEKCFYEEPVEIQSMSEEEVTAFRKELEVHISGPEPYRPVRAFSQLGFDEVLMKEIEKHKYEDPTPIQKQALPVALAGRDIIGIAQTGTFTCL